MSRRYLNERTRTTILPRIYPDNSLIDWTITGTETIHEDRITEISITQHQAALAIAASQVTDFDTEVANNTAVAANTAKVTNATHTGEVTGSGALTIALNAITNAKMADDAIGIAELSATGTPSSSTFLRGDNAWATPTSTMVYPAAGIAVSTGTAWGTSITNNSGNWNAAYGWGDHSLAGYLTSTHTADVDAHHTRYTDSEAVSATSGVYLPLSGGTVTGTVTVHSAASASSYFRVGTTTTGYDAGILLQEGGTSKWLIRNDASANLLEFYDYSISNTAMVIKEGGNVGIGTTSPDTSMHIMSGSSIKNYMLTLQQASSTDGHDTLIKFRNSSSSTNVFSSYIGSKRAVGGGGIGHLVFGTNPGGATVDNMTERMRITIDGNVGIGTTIPGIYNSKLDVVTGASPNNILALRTTDVAQGTTGTLLYLGLGATTGNTYGVIRALGGGGSGLANLVLQPVGNVLIGTTTDAGYKLDVNGTGRFAGELTVGSHLNMGDNDYIKLGTGNDFNIYHSGTHSYLKSNLAGAQVHIQGTNAGSSLKTMIMADPDGAANLYYAGLKKFETTSAGGTLTGTFTATGDIIAYG